MDTEGVSTMASIQSPFSWELKYRGDFNFPGDYTSTADVDRFGDFLADPFGMYSYNLHLHNLKKHNPNLLLATL